MTGLLIGCSSSSEPQLEENKAVVQSFIEAINNRDFNTLDELVDPNLVRHSQATPGINVRSLDDFKQFLRQDLETFPDAHQEVNMMIAEGDKVALYMTLTGTQEGAMGPYLASGKKVDVRFLGILRIDGGKIAEMWVEWDNINILTQLGHFPLPGEGEQ